MHSQPFNNSGALTVDKILGEAYDVVKRVDDNLPNIGVVAYILDDVELLSQNLQAAIGADTANEAITILSGISNFRVTFEGVVSDLPVDTYFTSSVEGELRLYRRTSGIPGYEDQGGVVAPFAVITATAEAARAQATIAQNVAVAAKDIAVEARDTAVAASDLVIAAGNFRTAYATALLSELVALPGPFDEGTSAAVCNGADKGIYAYLLGAWVKVANLPDEAASIAADRAEVAAYDALETANSFSNVLEFVVSKNLWNPAKRVPNELISTGDGGRQPVPGWSWSGMTKLPDTIVPGDKIVISANGSLEGGVGFYTTDTSPLPVAGGLHTTTGSVIRVITIPAGANYVGFNLKDNVASIPTQIQLEVGNAATAFEAYFAPIPKVRSDALSPDLKPYEILVASKNLFDDTSLKAGYLSTNTGEFLPSATWRTSGFIPVDPLTMPELTVQGERSQRGVSFFTSAANNAVIPGSYSSGLGTRTVAVPPTAKFVIIDLFNGDSPAFSNVQLEVGNSATAVVPFGSKIMIKSDMLDPPILSENGDSVDENFSVTLSEGGSSFINVPLGVGTLRINLSPFRTRNHSQSDVFDMLGESFNGVTFRSAGDDAAPYRTNNWHTGGNHGYALSTHPVPGHGKSLANQGSIYTDGSDEWVIVDIPNGEQIALTARGARNIYISNNVTLTHVSGGVNTAPFNSGVRIANSGATTQWYPSVDNHQIFVMLDGQLETNRNKQYFPKNDVTFYESYDVLDKASLVEWLITQVGTGTRITDYQGTPAYSVLISHKFDRLATCVTTNHFIARQDILNFNDIMFVQSAPFLSNVSGPVYYYAPGTLPFAEDGVNYDFSMLKNMTGFAPSGQIDFNVATRCLDTGHLADRLVMINNTVGMATGQLPVLSGSFAERRDNVTDKALIISSSGKVYVEAVDNAVNSLSAGDYYTGVVYKAWFPKVAGRTAMYPVCSTLADYLYIDWHNVDKVEQLDVPEKFRGRAFNLVQSKDAEILGRVATNSIFCKVSSLGGYGFTVLEFPK